MHHLIKIRDIAPAAFDYLQGIKSIEMKRIRNHLKIYSCILILAILCQSCVVYHKNPVSLEQAARENAKTKILFEDGKVMKYESVTHKDQQYFGTSKTRFDWINIPIEENAVSEVRVKNEKGSGTFTAATVIVAVGALVWIGASSFSVDAGEAFE